MESLAEKLTINFFFLTSPLARLLYIETLTPARTRLQSSYGMACFYINFKLNTNL